MDQLLYSQENKRISSLDMMRGFAILGIFLVNMLSFHSPLLYIDPLRWWTNPLDQSIYKIIDMLIEASFYPLFSLLFGYGLVILRENTQRNHLSFKHIAFRRLLSLLIFGLVHAFLIWHGDILFNYALFGFIFLVFIKSSGRNLLVIGICIYLIPQLFIVGLLYVAGLFMPGNEMDIYDPHSAAKLMDVYSNGTFFDITIQRMSDWYYVNNVGGLLIMMFSILPLFMIGAAAAKYKILENFSYYRKKLMIIMITVLIVALILKLLPYFITRNYATEYMQNIFGGPLLSIFYALGIAFLAEKKWFSAILQAFSYVGRMSFSNYLLQSLFSTFLFYHYGAGLYGQISLFVGTVIALGFFVLQVVFSRYWLQTHHYGPGEWVWRCMTYGKKQKWRK